ncbi:Ig-like domain-containing protein [Streptomyces pathocidini]|uniref:L,D-transpeptidase n=1 Tax=Streptomyces pathocidini TaxID=1650571 RepID=UPI00340EDD6F
MEKRVMTDGKRRSLTVAAVLLGSAVTLTACSSDAGGASGGSGTKAEAQAQVDRQAAEEASAARITITPKNGADNAGVNSDVKVQVQEGKLTKVTMTAVATGDEVPGTISADGSLWEPDGQLERSTTYKISAEAKDAKGLEAKEHSKLTTVSPDNSFIGNFTPEADTTVGVGMPVSVNFDKGITNKADVQRGVQVTSSSGQKVVGHWFNDNRLDFRPEDYWQAGSTVTLKLDLDGVEGAPGVQGIQEKTVTFKVGRSQVSTVDVETKEMTVVRDGQEVKKIPISAGSNENPTYNGQMVISEKFKETRMNGDSVGFKGEYDIKDVPHAMRLSRSGTFIHGNYWGKGIFGEANTSHGCVGLADVKGADDPETDGSWFYDNSLTGDVVIVKNSPDKTITPDNGLNGWNMPWNEWVAGSAIA